MNSFSSGISNKYLQITEHHNHLHTFLHLPMIQKIQPASQVLCLQFLHISVHQFGLNRFEIKKELCYFVDVDCHKINYLGMKRFVKYFLRILAISIIICFSASAFHFVISYRNARQGTSLGGQNYKAEGKTIGK